MTMQKLTMAMLLSVFATGVVAETEWVWYEKDALPVRGRGWTDVDSYYSRLPRHAHGKVPEAVWNMSHEATGLNIRFKTDADQIRLHWQVADEKKIDPLIPQSGTMGVDVYVYDAKEGWQFAGNHRYYGQNGKKGEAVFAWKPGRPGIIYLPYRSIVKDFKIGLPKGKSISAYPFAEASMKPVVHYGTSIVHGGCVSRPGLVFTSMAARMLGCEYINLGFSGMGKMELEMAQMLAEVEASVYVVDCVWNMDAKLIDERAKPFLRELKRLRPSTPILLCDGCRQNRNRFDGNVAMLAVFDSLKKEDAKLWANLYYLKAADMLPVNGEVTHDFCHPNDYGSLFMGKAYAKRIRAVMNLEERRPAREKYDAQWGMEGKTVHVQDRDVYVHVPNYDKSKIPPYTLENPLKFLDGREVTAANWADRRKEILDIFAKEMYGAEPPKPEAVVTEMVDEKVGAAAGFAIRRQYKMWFKADKSGPCINWIVWIPRFAKKPVPVISFLNYNGNHELVCDKDIPVPTAWCRFPSHDESLRHASADSRGKLQDANSDAIFPLGTILARGYAVMSCCYCEVSPDPDRVEGDRYRQGKFAYKGVFELWGERDESRTDNITSIGAWGWSLSRGLDLAERIPEIDAKKSVVTGYSRLGKSALMAAARDERFAVCVPNQTGGGGVPLAKRDYGENISTENRSFTHWYCRAYAKYAKDPHLNMPFDQHLFISCIAPRALLVQGFDSPWFDTEGEYLAVKAASPVWEMLVGDGMPKVAWPDDFDTSAIGKHLGYVRRSQGHGFSAYDWLWTMDFADKVLGK